MTAIEAHACRFRIKRHEGAWSVVGAYRERAVERISICAVCGSSRAARFRKIIFVERESAGSHSQPDLRMRRLAQNLDQRFQTSDLIRAQPFIRRFGGVHVESDLERLALYGGIRLIYQPRVGSLQLYAVRVINHTELAEIAEPGAAERRGFALGRARESTAGLLHPQAQAIAELLLADSAPRLDHQLITALAALAQLVEDGEVLPARLFSVKYLGHSKALGSLRVRLERLVGPLERLGIRDWGQIAVIGGLGNLNFNGLTLDLSRFQYLGLALQDAVEIQRIDFPIGGLLVVENLTPFHACVVQFASKHKLMVLWAAGFPGRGVLAIVRHAFKCGVPIRVWCDLDLGGVRIARNLAEVAPTAETILMDPAAVRTAQFAQYIEPALMAAIRRDLTLHPAGLLADSLRAMVECGRWVEQETLLDRIDKVLGN